MVDMQEGLLGVVGGGAAGLLTASALGFGSGSTSGLFFLLGMFVVGVVVFEIDIFGILDTLVGDFI